MTTQAVSVCNVLGGIALSAEEASAIAEMIEPYLEASAIEDPDLVRQVERFYNVLNGQPPCGRKQYRMTGKSGRGWVEIEEVTA